MYIFYSEQIENMTLKLDVEKRECCMYKELKSSDEQAIYQEYITCLKKYQLALK